MANTMDDLAQIYIDAGLTPPERFVGDTTEVTAQDIVNTQNFVASQAATTFTPTTTASTGDVTASDVLSWFAAAGEDPSRHTDGSYEDPLSRANRIANEINSGQRTTAEVQQAITSISEAGPISAEDVLAWFEAAGRDPSLHADGSFEDPQQRAQRIANEVNAGLRTVDQVQQAITAIPIPDRAQIPPGGRLVRVTNPEGSDAAELFYLVYDWRGLDLAYEIGDAARLDELFGGVFAFDSMSTLSQAGFDNQGFTLTGSVDTITGSTETIASQMERELRALGLEDLPSWLADSPDALSLTVIAANQQWSSGRLWKELSTTQAFTTRFGGALSLYLQEGISISQAVDRLVADENALRTAVRPFLVGDTAATTEYLQGLLQEGWTPGFVAQVLEQAEDLRRDPDSLLRANFILEASGLATLDEVGFLNALNGFGPQETIEALNTATAARALAESGIDLDDADLELIMGLVDTSDRLLTVDAWRDLAQELSFNLIRFNTELDQKKLGLVEDDLVAAAFGRQSPSGRSSGEVLGLLARLERDRRVAGQGIPGSTGFIDAEGDLRLQGISAL